MKTNIWKKLLAIGVLLSLGSAASAQESLTLKVTLFSPPPAPQNVLLRNIDEKLRAETGGRLKLQLFEASQMGPPTRQFDLVRTRVADMSFVLLGLTPGRFDLAQISEMPGVVGPGITGEAARRAATAVLNLSDKHLRNEFSGTKLLNFALIPNPLVFTARKIDKLEQFQGLRIRHPGANHARLVKDLGAVPVLLNPLEISEALSRGQVDGALTSYSAVDSWNLQDVIKHGLEIDSGALAFALVINQATLDSMPKDLRVVFDRYFGPANQSVWATFMGNAEEQLRKKYLSRGIEARRLSPDQEAKFNEISAASREKALAELEGRGLKARDFYTDLRKSIEALR